MITKRFLNRLFLMSLLTLASLSFTTYYKPKFLNGVVCNDSSIPIWLTITESGLFKAYELHPGNCTDRNTMDAEAIWGRNCNKIPCKYQAWKVGAGRFTVKDFWTSPIGSVLTISGRGLGSGWKIHPSWKQARPPLEDINYSLTRKAKR